MKKVIQSECDRCGDQVALIDVRGTWTSAGTTLLLEVGKVCPTCFLSCVAFVNSRPRLHPQLASARQWAARWKALAKRTGDAATNKRVRDVLAHQHSFLAEHADSMADLPHDPVDDDSCPSFRAEVLRSDQGLAPVDMPADSLCVCGHGVREHFNTGRTGAAQPCHAATPDVRLPLPPSIDFTHCGCCKFELARRVKR